MYSERASSRCAVSACRPVRAPESWRGKEPLVRVWASEANARFQVYRLIERDPVDPGTEFGLAAKRLDRVVNLEKYLLRHVFGFRNELPAQNRNRQAKHGRTMAANQFSESLLSPLCARVTSWESLSTSVNAEAHPSGNGRRSGPRPKRRTAGVLPSHHATDREESDRARPWLQPKE